MGGRHRCVKPAIVGWGNPARWLCQQHFEEALEGVRGLVNRLENEIRASFPDDGG
jgi:hypothetical protein